MKQIIKVKVSVEKDSFELAKILFNQNVIVEYNQLIEVQNLDKESTIRPKSSKVIYKKYFFLIFVKDLNFFINFKILKTPKFK